MIGAALGCAAMFGAGLEAQAQPIQPDSYVIGGELSKACAWPSVAMVHTFYPENPKGQQHGLCTGTFVHPRVVIFASHCGDAIGISVGLDRHAPNRITEFEKVGRNPAWNEKDIKTTKFDWAYAVLKKPLEGVATIPIAYGCELDMVQKPGQEVRLVGYSDNNVSIPPDPDKFVQRWAKAKISQVGGGAFVAGAPGVGVRSGDSGGPLLAKLEDGTWRTLGIISRADGSGAGVSKEMIQWFNKETGIDVVPCFDDDGKPTEGKACDELRAFSGDPENPTADPKDNCIGAPTKWAGLACGLKKSDGSDPEDEDEPKDESPDEPKDESPDDSKDESPDESAGDSSSDSNDDPTDESKDESDNESPDDSSGEPTEDTDGESPKEPTDESKDKPDDGSNNGSDTQAPKSQEPEKSQPNGAEEPGDNNEDPPAKGCRVSSGNQPTVWMLFALLACGLRGRRRHG